jgi:hypothetical protein
MCQRYEDERTIYNMLSKAAPVKTDELTRAAELETALVALIDAVDAKDEKAIQNALFVGRGLTF